MLILDIHDYSDIEMECVDLQLLCYIEKSFKYAGSKKWQRTQMIAIKRQQRSLLRGFDLAAINSVRVHNNSSFSLYDYFYYPPEVV